MKIIAMPINSLTPYKNNAKKHPKKQIEQIMNSITEFGMIDPIGIWGDDNIIVQVKGKEKHETIKSIFTGTLKDRGRAYVLIRIKSNERYNALFVNIYNNDDDNDVEF